MCSCVLRADISLIFIWNIKKDSHVRKYLFFSDKSSTFKLCSNHTKSSLMYSIQCIPLLCVVNECFTAERKALKFKNKNNEAKQQKERHWIYSEWTVASHRKIKKKKHIFVFAFFLCLSLSLCNSFFFQYFVW